MKILVIGSSGQLGRCLQDQLIGLDMDINFSSKDQIDMLKPEQFTKKITEIGPDVIINASGYTEVDAAELNQEKAFLLNNIAVSKLADICQEINSCLIHFSTDYVFDGFSKQPYNEEDTTSPASMYGLSKLEGELSIQSSGCRYFIFRTSWAFSEYGKNFLKRMLQLAEEKAELDIVGDQFGCPTYMHDLAKVIREILQKKNFINLPSGIYHYAGDQECSWYEFADLIFSEANKLGFKIPYVRSVKSGDFKSRAVRPLYSSLDCSKIKDQYGIQSSNWKAGIIHTLNKLI